MANAIQRLRILEPITMDCRFLGAESPIVAGLKDELYQYDRKVDEVGRIHSYRPPGPHRWLGLPEELRRDEAVVPEAWPQTTCPSHSTETRGAVCTAPSFSTLAISVGQRAPRAGVRNAAPPPSQPVACAMVSTYPPEAQRSTERTKRRQAV